MCIKIGIWGTKKVAKQPPFLDLGFLLGRVNAIFS